MFRSSRTLHIGSYPHPWSVYQVSIGSKDELTRVSDEIKDELEHGIITPLQARKLTKTLDRIELVLDIREEAIKDRPLIDWDEPTERGSSIVGLGSNPSTECVVNLPVTQRETIPVQQPVSRSIVVTQVEQPVRIRKYNKYGILMEDRDETEEERYEREYQEWKKENDL